VTPLAARMLAQDVVAQRLVALPYGTALLSPALPAWYEGNHVRVERRPAGWTADAIFHDARQRLADAGLAHRRLIVVDRELHEPLAALAAADAWDVTWLVAMVLRGRADRPPPSVAVEQLDAETYALFRRRQLAAHDWAREPGVLDQILAADAREHATGRVRRFGVHDTDGTLAGMATLQRFGGAGEVDNVEVLEERRGRGLGRAVVAAVADAARAASCEPVFLVVDADDPVPMKLYEQLGFETVDRMLELTLRPAAATG
jgi:ribosomal protein S18 acetylase RimI-like enzyme